MATQPKSRRRQRKKILRKNDGSMFDATERRRITKAELRDYVRDGGLFEARRHENGADCTYEVLQSVMGAGILQNVVPGLGGGGPLGALGGLVGLGRLGGLANGGGALADIARALEGGGDRGWDDWDEPHRRPRRSDEHRWDNPDWAEPDGAEPASGRTWRDDPDWAADPDFE